MKDFEISIQTFLSQPIRYAPQYIPTVQPPVYRASTIIFRDTDAFTERHWTDRHDYSYGTHGTPTTYTLADQIAQLEGADYCILAPSGLSAINLVNSTFLDAGDEVWIPDNIYGPNYEHLASLQSKYGIILKVYSAIDPSTIKFSSISKLIWIEAAGSVTLEFPDIVSIIKLAQTHHVLTALDNTWGAGLAFKPYAIGEEQLAIDISVHALTKYPSGGADILMGSISTKNKDLYFKMLKTHALQGIAISGDDAAQITRSLPHMAIRYTQHQNNSQTLIEYLQQRPEIAQILHPTLAEHAGHQYWKEICTAKLAAGLISIIIDPKYTLNDVKNFCNALKLFRLGFSWGGPTSLVMYYNLKDMRQLPTPHLKSGWLIRFCIGLENSKDLIQDLEIGFQQLS
ncbi:PLP-dependent transferase [Acinetobacter sp. AL9]|uniref:PLP-dependent transferase n=1 Tax=Acinetobacter sp. AL9 TaxID=3273234 RepID=UPI003557B479